MTRAAALLDAPLAIVDLETTGAHPAWDRITEIAVLEARLDAAGEGEITETWSTLVNPGAAIPAAIQALTGITNEMVADAPRFEAIAQALLERLEGRLFVAHNARFDYGFLRHAFERAGLAFSAKTLCTVRLSRRLYPQHHRHNLDSLIARHGIVCSARHRALGDAEAVWHFLRAAAAEHGEAVLGTAARLAAREAAVPPQLSRAEIDAVPEAPGVYLLYGERDVPLYVGKSVAMRSRLMSHFTGAAGSPREAQLARETRRIEWRRTAGELGALLREAELVKTLAPVFNRALRREQPLCGFVLERRAGGAEDPAKSLRLVEAPALDAALAAELHGVFRTRRAALEALRGLADAHGLCLQSLGFESAAAARGGACFRHQIRRCAGLCAGRETLAAHQARLAAALAGLRTVAWPWRGPIGVLETDPTDPEKSELQVIDNWCWLGTATDESEVAALIESSRAPRFDLDHYRILLRHLNAGRRRARIVELAPRLMHAA